MCLLIVGMISVLLAACGGGDAVGGNSGNNNDNNENAADAENNDNDDGSVSVADYTIRFGTGTETGLYYPIGAVLSNFWASNIDGLSASSQATNGSVQNLIFMQDGDIELSLTMGNVLEEAYNGKRGFDGQPYEDVRVIGHMYPNFTQWVIRERSGMESIADIVGRDFGAGATGSGTDVASQEVFEAYGITYDDVNIHHGGFPETTDMMRNNQIDMANIVVGIPGAAVGEMISTADGVLTSIDPEAMEYLTSTWDYWFESVIPAGTYDGQDNDVTTAAIANVLVADASMPDEVAYEITKMMWENIEELTGSHEVFNQFIIDDYKQGIPNSIPFHDGAIKYYEEIGVW